MGVGRLYQMSNLMSDLELRSVHAWAAETCSGHKLLRCSCLPHKVAPC